jgi:hypothetical protein
VRVFKTKVFDKWARNNKVPDSSLIDAAIDVSIGRVEATMGGGIYKKRIATKGRGKSSSVRTIIALKMKTECFYIFGYEKNEKSNVSKSELNALQMVAKGLFSKEKKELTELIKNGAIIEVKNEQTN